MAWHELLLGQAYVEERILHDLDLRERFRLLRGKFIWTERIASGFAFAGSS